MNLIGLLESENNLLEKEKLLQEFLDFYPAKETPEKGDRDSLYIGLDQNALSTPFEDYYTIYKSLDGDLIDYGAGFAKGSILFNYLGRKNKCISYEILESRYTEAYKIYNKSHFDKSELVVRDLLQEPIPRGENYLIYLPLGDVLFRLLNFLYINKREANLYIIESHGDILDYVFELTDLFRLEEILPSRMERHKKGIYKFRFNPKVSLGNIFIEYIKSYNSDKEFRVSEGDKVMSFNLRKSLPIKYNGKLCIESFELKRIVDGRVIQPLDFSLKTGE